MTIHGWDGEGRVKGAKPVHDPAARTLAFTLPDQPRAARIAVTR